MVTPFFSIITICKNSENNIQGCLSSIYNQSFQDYEHIVCDGNSLDSTIKIIDKNKRESTKVFIENDKGLYYALNKGIRKSLGKYLLIIHSDDRLYNNKVLEKLNEEIINNNSPLIITNNTVYINSKGKILRKWKSDLPTIKKIKMGWMAPHTGLVLNRNIANSIGPYNTKFKISADYDYELRLFKKYIKDVLALDLTLVKNKIGGISNRDINSIIRKTIEDYKIMKLHCINPFIGLFFKNFNKLNQLLV